MKGLTLTLLAAAVLALAACGGADKPAAGTPGNPLVATVQAGPTAASAGPGSQVAGATQGSSSESGTSSPKAANGAPSTSKRSKAGASPAPKQTAVGETGAGTAPNYESLVGKQTSKPASRFTPCNLVTPSQASAILGAAVREPIEAPQGPTCIYRTQTGKAFITLAVQTTSFKQLRKQLRRPKKVTVGGRTGYCGVYGQPMLYVPLADGRRVLSVSAACAVGTQFATRAIATLTK